MIMTQQEAKAIFDKVLALTVADECTMNLSSAKDSYIRFANNSVTTSGIARDTILSIQVAFGSRSAETTVNSFGDAELKAAVEQVEAMARIAPENPEFVAAIGPQTYLSTPTYSAETAAIDPARRAKGVGAVIAPCKEAGLESSGYYEDSTGSFATANNKGNFGYHTQTRLNFTTTVRTADGTGSARVSRFMTNVDEFTPAAYIRPVMNRARASTPARAIEPGRYTVVLEPAASASLISYMLSLTDARSADEGRSFLSRKGGGNRLGEALMDPRVTIISDPADPDAPVLPWDRESLPRKKMVRIRNGKVEQLTYDRYWAKAKGVEPVAMPDNLRMEGGTKTTAQLIAETERGIYVSRTWYIRMVDPQSLLLTGLTRDGTFYIENGKIRYPLKNMRFNESPIIMLNNIDELGIPERVMADPGPGAGRIAYPSTYADQGFQFQFHF